MKTLIRQRIADSIQVKQALLGDENVIQTIQTLASAMIACIRQGGKLVVCGNGGSASDAVHFVGEIVGRFQKERRPLPAMALNADIAVLTAIANDYGYDNVFARQVRACLTEKDMLIGISTSGNSENVYRAVKAAGEIGAVTAGLLGKDGGKIAGQADYALIVPSFVTARIQEAHIMVIHILCELLEENMAE